MSMPDLSKASAILLYGQHRPSWIRRPASSVRLARVVADDDAVVRRAELEQRRAQGAVVVADRVLQDGGHLLLLAAVEVVLDEVDGELCDVGRSASRAPDQLAAGAPGRVDERSVHPGRDLAAVVPGTGGTVASDSWQLKNFWNGRAAISPASLTMRPRISLKGKRDCSGSPVT